MTSKRTPYQTAADLEIDRLQRKVEELTADLEIVCADRDAQVDAVAALEALCAQAGHVIRQADVSCACGQHVLGSDTECSRCWSIPEGQSCPDCGHVQLTVEDERNEMLGLANRPINLSLPDRKMHALELLAEHQERTVDEIVSRWLEGAMTINVIINVHERPSQPLGTAKN